MGERSRKKGEQSWSCSKTEVLGQLHDRSYYVFMWQKSQIAGQDAIQSHIPTLD